MAFEIRAILPGRIGSCSADAVISERPSLRARGAGLVRIGGPAGGAPAGRRPAAGAGDLAGFGVGRVERAGAADPVLGRVRAGDRAAPLRRGGDWRHCGAAPVASMVRRATGLRQSFRLCLRRRGAARGGAGARRVAEARRRRDRAGRADVRPFENSDHRRHRPARPAAGQSVLRWPRRPFRARLLLSLAFQRRHAQRLGRGERLGSRHCADLVYRLCLARPDDRVCGQAQRPAAGAALGRLAQPRCLAPPRSSVRARAAFFRARAVPGAVAAGLDLSGELGAAAPGLGRLRRGCGADHVAPGCAAQLALGSAARRHRGGRVRKLDLGRRRHLRGRARCRSASRFCWPRRHPNPDRSAAEGRGRGHSRRPDLVSFLPRRISGDGGARCRVPDRAAAVRGAGRHPASERSPAARPGGLLGHSAGQFSSPRSTSPARRRWGARWPTRQRRRRKSGWSSDLPCWPARASLFPGCSPARSPTTTSPGGACCPRCWC